jgi:hypothetical protein
MFRTLETFLVMAAEDLSNKIFCLGLVCQESRLAAKKAAGKPPGPARPSFESRR